jgi:2-C-methyl-D-erythritol 4-phosphate cytidylyltransferase/2-C-methyl-D-erythritol 2,4-cyclodiphosphate synthase
MTQPPSLPPKPLIAIVVAAGRGERAAGAASELPKQYRPIGGEAVLKRALAALLAVPEIDRVVAVINAAHRGLYEALGLADPRLLPPVFGGATRQASVLEGLRAIAPLKPDRVLIHDAARPFVPAPVVASVVEGLRTAQAVVPGVAVTDTIKRAPDGRLVLGTEERTSLFAAQTPQGFRFGQILSAHMRASALPRDFTDDAAIAEWAGLTTVLAAGSTDNFKITHPADFERAERMLQGGLAMETRVGTGFDVHPFEAGTLVTLGGVAIPHDMGLKGHSDADAGLHALADAIYGALGAGDIGTHFPPSDPQWRGAASSVFLTHAAGMVAERGGRIVNLDLTLVCEAPRIGPHVPAMKAAIAAACAISPSRVAVKATTSEQLGFTGRREGIAALASASIEVPRID